MIYKNVNENEMGKDQKEGELDMIRKRKIYKLFKHKASQKHNDSCSLNHLN